jgi:hypothetical protein
MGLAKRRKQYEAYQCQDRGRARHSVRAAGLGISSERRARSDAR